MILPHAITASIPRLNSCEAACVVLAAEFDGGASKYLICRTSSARQTGERADAHPLLLGEDTIVRNDNYYYANGRVTNAISRGTNSRGREGERKRVIGFAGSIVSHRLSRWRARHDFPRGEIALALDFQRAGTLSSEDCFSTRVCYGSNKRARAGGKQL